MKKWMSDPLFSYNFAFHVSCDRLKEVNLLTLLCYSDVTSTSII